MGLTQASIAGQGTSAWMHGWLDEYFHHQPALKAAPVANYLNSLGCQATVPRATPVQQCGRRKQDQPRPVLHASQSQGLPSSSTSCCEAAYTQLTPLKLYKKTTHGLQQGSASIKSVRNTTPRLCFLLHNESIAHLPFPLLQGGSNEACRTAVAQMCQQ